MRAPTIGSVSGPVTRPRMMSVFCWAEAGEAATKADVGRLLLTHLIPAWFSEASIVDAASAAYAGPVEVVRPGARYDL